MNTPGFTAHLTIIAEQRRYRMGYSSLRDHRTKSVFIPSLAGTACPTTEQNALCSTWANVADFFPCGTFLWWGDVRGWEYCIYAHVPPFCWNCSFFPK